MGAEGREFESRRSDHYIKDLQPRLQVLFLLCRQYLSASRENPAMASVSDSSSQRLVSIDALRGAALLWMTGFHFCFDLDYFGWWPQDFLHDARWTLQRTAIVSVFVFCAGMGQAVAHEQSLGWRRFWRRWWQIVACAAIVTAASWFMFPRSFIYFGVLHGMALMLLIARISAGWGLWLWPLGALAVFAPTVAHVVLTGGMAEWASVFNSRVLNWLGLVTRKPFTEDYVPLLPWLGVLWWGLASGRWLLRRKRRWLAHRLPRVATPLVAMGRWSLSYYMLHQPVMMGGMAAVAWWLQRAG